MKGDFMGFSFDGIHCSELGITRVSNGDRYDEELLPEISDRDNEIVGEDGGNYFGSEYREKTISIDIAFDSMTETQFRKIRKLFGTKKICELIFDERPYKVYSAKVASPIELNYICFDEFFKYEGEKRDGVRVKERNTHTETIIDEETGEEKEIVVTDITREKVTPLLIDKSRKQRIYKGEGTIELICYYPFAKQLYKVLDLYRPENKEKYGLITTYKNVDEWAESSGLLDAATFNNYNIDKTCVLENVNDYNLEIPVYNPGDLNTGFYLYIPFTSFEEDCNEVITIASDTTQEVYLLYTPVSTPTIIADDGISYHVDEQNNRKYYVTNNNTNPVNITFQYNYMDSPSIKPNSGDYIKIFGDENGLLLKPIEKKSDIDTGIIINTVNHLIEGVNYDPITELNDYRNKTWTITHNIYNECIAAGDFPKILRSDWRFDDNQFKQAIYLNCEVNEGEEGLIQINYDYLYF